MALLYPVLIAAAGVIAWRRRRSPGGRGRSWFCAWCGAGFLLSFSFATGFSIGLLLFPLAAVAVIWVARCSPHLAEACGFAVGSAATALIVVAVAYG